MTTPIGPYGPYQAAIDLALRGVRVGSAATYEVNIAITSHVELTTKPDVSRPFTMRATRLSLHWWWRDGEWRLSWNIYGHRWRRTTNDWSPHEKGYMNDWYTDLPDWMVPLIEANAPTNTPTVEVTS